MKRAFIAAFLSAPLLSAPALARLTTTDPTSAPAQATAEPAAKAPIGPLVCSDNPDLGIGLATLLASLKLTKSFQPTAAAGNAVDQFATYRPDGRKNPIMLIVNDKRVCLHFDGP